MNDIDDVLTAIRALPVTGENLQRLITSVWRFADACHVYADTQEVQELLLDASEASESMQTWGNLIAREA